MIVSIDNVLLLSEHHPNEFKYYPINDVISNTGQSASDIIWEKDVEIPEEKIIELKERGAEYIDLLFSNSLYKMLVIYKPEVYKNPSALKSFMEIDKIINTYEQINRVSGRHRNISFMFELYTQNGKKNEPVFRFNEIIDFKKWNNIKRKIKKNSQLPILYNEIGIIVFVDLTNKGKNDYVERFKKNTDLCSILAQRRADNAGFKISSDFNRLTDIWAVNEPYKLMNTYIEKKARLIVVGDKITDIYKEALLQVKKYDKFARFIVVTDIDTCDTKSLLVNIREAYNKDNYSYE